MLHLYKAFFILLSLFTGHVVARNGCRQCNGYHRVTFVNYVDRDTAVSFFQKSIENCATGKQYTITQVFKDNCEDPITERGRCSVWSFTTRIWRYCGNGSSATLKKNGSCMNNVCVASESHTMECSHSVDCVGTCHCDQCGC